MLDKHPGKLNQEKQGKDANKYWMKQEKQLKKNIMKECLRN